MSVDELKAELDKRTRTLLAIEIENLPITVRNIVNHNAGKILLASLGFEESFGRLEIKRGSDQNSPIARAIGDAAIQQLQLAIPDFIKEYITDLGKAELLQEAGRRDYKYQLHRQCMDHVHKFMEEEAKSVSQKIIATLKLQETK